MNGSATLVEVARGKKIGDRLRLNERYTELLQDGGIENADELCEVASQLGRTADQMMQDSLAIESFALSEKRLVAAIEAGVRANAVAARQQLADFNTETARLIAQRELQRIALDDTEYTTTSALSRAAGDEDTLRRLAKLHPLLLGDRTIPSV